MTAHYALPPSTAPDTCVQGGYTRCRWKSGGSVTHDVASSESRSGRPGAERARTAMETSDQRLTYEDALKLKSSTPVAPWTRRASYRGERRFPPLRSRRPRANCAPARAREAEPRNDKRRVYYPIIRSASRAGRRRTKRAGGAAAGARARVRSPRARRPGNALAALRARGSDLPLSFDSSHPSLSPTVKSRAHPSLGI